MSVAEGIVCVPGIVFFCLTPLHVRSIATAHRSFFHASNRSRNVAGAYSRRWKIISNRPKPVWRLTVYLLYNLTMIVSGLFLLPYYWLYGLRHGRSHRSIRERLGRYTPEQLAQFEQQIIWIHAASVGEARAVFPLLAAIRKQYPHGRLLMTNMT